VHINESGKKKEVIIPWPGMTTGGKSASSVKKPAIREVINSVARTVLIKGYHQVPLIYRWGYLKATDMKVAREDRERKIGSNE